MRHLLRPACLRYRFGRQVRAEGVPLHDAEGRAHNGVYVKDSRHGRREAAPGYRLWSVGPSRNPGAAAAQVCGADDAGKVDLRGARRRLLSAGRGRGYNRKPAVGGSGRSGKRLAMNAAPQISQKSLHASCSLSILSC